MRCHRGRICCLLVFRSCFLNHATGKSTSNMPQTGHFYEYNARSTQQLCSKYDLCQPTDPNRKHIHEFTPQILQYQRQIEHEFYQSQLSPELYSSENSQTSKLFLSCISSVNTMLKNGFVLVQISRFRQVIGAFTLQNTNESNKVSKLSLYFDFAYSADLTCM